MTEFCQNCGAPFESNEQKFCLNCGESIKTSGEDEKIVNESSKKGKATSGFKKLLKVIGVITLSLFLLSIAFIIYALISPTDDKPSTSIENTITHEDSNALDSDTSLGNNANTSDVYAENNTINNNILEEYLGTYSIHLTFTEYIYENEKVQEYIGQTYVDLIKLQKNQSDELFINLSTPAFNQLLPINSFDDGQLSSAFNQDGLEIILEASLDDQAGIFMSGFIFYNDNLKPIEMVFDFEVFPNKTVSLSEINRTYNICFRNSWLTKSLYDNLPNKNWSENTTDYTQESYTIQYDLSENQIIMTSNNDTNRNAVYQLRENKKEGYLLSTSTPFFTGEDIFIQPIYNPKLQLIEMIFFNTTDDGYIVTSLEGYENSLQESDGKAMNTTNNTNDILPSAWYGTEALPFYMIIDEGTLTIPNNPNYDFSYENETIDFNNQGFLLTNAMDLIPFVLPYEKDGSTYTIKAEVYGGKAFNNSSLTKYYVKDRNNNNIYAMNGLDIPILIDELPESYIFADFYSQMSIKPNNSLTYEINLNYYEEGYDPNNPDDSYKETYQNSIELQPQN